MKQMIDDSHLHTTALAEAIPRARVVGQRVRAGQAEVEDAWTRWHAVDRAADRERRA